MSHVHAALRQAAALLLGYPDDGWPERRTLVASALAELPEPDAAPLRRFCAATANHTVLELAAHYVATFDRSRRRTLHLSYYTDGDTRRRGATLAAWKARYRAHGWECPPDELPDHLPLVLEFAAHCPGPGTELLTEHRAGLDLLHQALTRHDSPYADVLRAVIDTLPRPSRDDVAAVRALAAAGPPAEAVGLAPYAAPTPAAHQEGAAR